MHSVMTHITHWGRVTHICVGNLGHQKFRWWLIAWSAASHYLNQFWNIVNWAVRNKIQWHFNRNSYIFIQENAFEYVVWKMAAILYRPHCDNQPQVNEVSIGCCNDLSPIGLNWCWFWCVLIPWGVDKIFSQNNKRLCQERAFQKRRLQISAILSRPHCVNPLKLSDACMRQWNKPSSYLFIYFISIIYLLIYLIFENALSAVQRQGVIRTKAGVRMVNYIISYKLQWNLNQNTTVSSQKINLKMSVCHGLAVLTVGVSHVHLKKVMSVSLRLQRIWRYLQSQQALIHFKIIYGTLMLVSFRLHANFGPLYR